MGMVSPLISVARPAKYSRQSAANPASCASAETGLPLLDVSLLQTGKTGVEADGLQRDWPEANLGVAKHYGYAFQWWGLAALIATLYVWFQIVRRIRNRRSA